MATTTVQRYLKPSREFLSEKLSCEELADSPQDLCVHGRRHSPGLGVLLARVIDTKEPRASTRQFRFSTVGKMKCCSRRDQTSLLQDFQICVPCDFSEREHCAGLQNFQLASPNSRGNL